MNLINKNSKSPLLALLNLKRLEISPKNGWRARVASEPMTSFPNWRDTVNNVRNIIQQQDEYIYIPNLIYSVH